MLEGGDVLIGEPSRAVVRFSGRAGPFRYRTVEDVRFLDSIATFEHLQGPFHRCREAIHIEPESSGGATIAHGGELAMRDGLLGWVFGVAAIRPVLERHVGSQLRQLAAADRSPRE